MMEALWPFGVPKVRSSMPELAMRPVGLEEVEEEDIVRMIGVVALVVVWRMCFEVW